MALLKFRIVNEVPVETEAHTLYLIAGATGPFALQVTDATGAVRDMAFVGVRTVNGIDPDANGNLELPLNVSSGTNILTTPNTSGAQDIDPTVHGVVKDSIDGARTYTFDTTNLVAGDSYGLVFDVTLQAGATLTFPSSVKFPNNTPPSWAAGKRYMVAMITTDGGAVFSANSNEYLTS